jgi:hypothetical protein
MSKLIKAPPTQIAVWGGNLARTTGADGKWLSIPTGHLPATISFGTSSSPDASATLTTTADDLCAVIWQPISTINIKACRIYYGQGGSTNTTHSACLMRYNIDTDGDLAFGVEVGAVQLDSNSDDYSQLRSMDLVINAANKKVTSGDLASQVLIAMIVCHDDINASVSGKCIIEYTSL